MSNEDLIKLLQRQKDLLCEDRRKLGLDSIDMTEDVCISFLRFSPWILLWIRDWSFTKYFQVTLQVPLNQHKIGPLSFSLNAHFKSFKWLIGFYFTLLRRNWFTDYLFSLSCVSRSSSCDFHKRNSGWWENSILVILIQSGEAPLEYLADVYQNFIRKTVHSFNFHIRILLRISILRTSGKPLKYPMNVIIYLWHILIEI